MRYDTPSLRFLFAMTEQKTDKSQPSIFNLPNNLTIARIVMIPLFVAIAYYPPALGIGIPAIPDNAIARLGMMEYSNNLLRHFLLTLIFVLAAITDWLDSSQNGHHFCIWAIFRPCSGQTDGSGGTDYLGAMASQYRHGNFGNCYYLKRNRRFCPA